MTFRPHLSVVLSLVAALSASTLAGCASMSDVVDEHREGGGTAVDYDIDPATAISIARDVFRAEGADAVEDHPEDWSVRATMGADLLHAGTMMAAWVAQVGPMRVRVTVVTKRRMQTNLVTGLTESTFHERFRERVVLALRGAR